MLADKDRIFTNVYGFQDWRLKAAKKRGDWDDTKALIARGQDAIIEEIKASEVVSANQRLYVNREDGFIGLNWRQHEFVTECTILDSVLTIMGDASLKVTKVADKTFMGRDIKHIAIWPKEGDTNFYTMIYQDGGSGKAFAKKFQIGGLSRDKLIASLWPETDAGHGRTMSETDSTGYGDSPDTTDWASTAYRGSVNVVEGPDENQQVIDGVAFVDLAMTIYGALYFIVHDGLVHQRWPFRHVPRRVYLKRLVQAHRLRHQVGSDASGKRRDIDHL